MPACAVWEEEDSSFENLAQVAPHLTYADLGEMAVDSTPEAPCQTFQR